MKNLILASALTLAALSPAANAGKVTPTVSIMLPMGQWIAEQGNAALREIREDFKRDLKNRIRPLLPEPSGPVAQSTTDPA